LSWGIDFQRHEDFRLAGKALVEEAQLMKISSKANVNNCKFGEFDLPE